MRWVGSGGGAPRVVDLKVRINKFPLKTPRPCIPPLEVQRNAWLSPVIPVLSVQRKAAIRLNPLEFRPHTVRIADFCPSIVDAILWDPMGGMRISVRSHAI
jgi:hypothetical protein